MGIEHVFAHGDEAHAVVVTVSHETGTIEHTGHVIFFGIAFVVYAVLAVRLYWLEYRRTGRWQAPK